MKTPCYHCEKRTASWHTTCEGYIDSLKKYHEEKEIQKHKVDSRLITERYELDRADKIKRYMRDRRRK